MSSKRSDLLEYLKNTLLPTVKPSAGYNMCFNTIERGHRNPDSLGEHQFPAIFITSTQEKRKNITHNQFMADPLQVILVGYVQSTKSNDDLDISGVQLDLDKFIEDVTKVLETDRLQTGLVKWTEISDIATDEGDLYPVAGCVISVNFSYTTEGISP